MWNGRIRCGKWRSMWSGGELEGGVMCGAEKLEVDEGEVYMWNGGGGKQVEEHMEWKEEAERQVISGVFGQVNK